MSSHEQQITEFLGCQCADYPHCLRDQSSKVCQKGVCQWHWCQYVSLSYTLSSAEYCDCGNCVHSNPLLPSFCTMHNMHSNNLTTDVYSNVNVCHYHIIHNLHTLHLYVTCIHTKLLQSPFNLLKVMSSSLEQHLLPVWRIISLISHNRNNCQTGYCYILPSVLWRCWLGGRKGIRPVKKWVMGCWRGCLGWGADLHIAQQMPLPLTISCSTKSRLVLTFLVLPFWYLLTQVVPDKFQKSRKTVVCVCMCVTAI